MKKIEINLSKIELEIMRLIFQEKTNNEISEIQGKSVRTIENQRRTIIKKIGAKNTVGLMKYALINKMVKLPKKYKSV